MSTFWLVVLAEIALFGILVGLLVRETRLTEILAGVVICVVLTGVIAFNVGSLPQSDRDHWLLKPLKLVGLGGGNRPSKASSPKAVSTQSEETSFKKAYGTAQKTFEAKRAEFAQQYMAAPNEIKKSAVWNAANEWTINFAKDQGLTASKWIARVAKISTAQGGSSADVELVSDYAGMNITYRVAGSSSLKSGTLVYNKLAELSLGDIVEFDALFRESSKKGFDEDSWTEKGSLEQPAFRINLTDIRKWSGKPNSR